MPSLRNPRRLLESILRHIELDRRHNSMQQWRIAAFAASRDVATLINARRPPLSPL